MTQRVMETEGSVARICLLAPTLSAVLDASEVGTVSVLLNQTLVQLFFDSQGCQQQERCSVVR